MLIDRRIVRVDDKVHRLPMRLRRKRRLARLDLGPRRLLRAEGADQQVRPEREGGRVGGALPDSRDVDYGVRGALPCLLQQHRYFSRGRPQLPGPRQWSLWDGPKRLKRGRSIPELAATNPASPL